MSARPPYARYAFLNPYNLSLLAGAAAAALATDHWWLGVFAAAGETLWMLFAPDSRLLRKAWFDPQWRSEQAARQKVEQAAKLAQLGDADQKRVEALRKVHERILQLARDNQSLTVDLLKGELDGLDGLVSDFLDLGLAARRYDEHLAGVDIAALEQDRRRYELQVETLPPGDNRRAVAQSNLTVLLRRKDRWQEVRRNLQSVRGQMDLMENTFRLLADEILSIRTPAELNRRLDEMREGVETVRNTARETEHLLQGA